MLYGVQDIARNMFGLSAHSERLRPGEFWALDNISFELKKGETLGIIGPNGAGKTTLLKLLNGIFNPDEGKIRMKGKVGALIQIGAGFHPLLTGKENIYINGSILGMSKKEIDKKLHSIIDFADIGDFIDSPVKYYSSGMYVRLGFAIAIHCNPDILLVDEILAVGDMAFQRKCLERMKDFRKQEKTIVFISHNLHSVRTLCKKAFFLEEGRIIKEGEVNKVVNYYIDEINKKVLENVQRLADETPGRIGTGEVRIVSIRLMDGEGKETKFFKTGEKLHIKVDYFAEEKIISPNFGVVIFTTEGIRITNTSTQRQGCSPEFIEGKGWVKCTYDSLPLMPGNYSITVAIYDENVTVSYDRWENAILFRIVEGDFIKGLASDFSILYLPAKWEFNI